MVTEFFVKGSTGREYLFCQSCFPSKDGYTLQPIFIRRLHELQQILAEFLPRERVPQQLARLMRQGQQVKLEQVLWALQLGRLHAFQAIPVLDNEQSSTASREIVKLISALDNEGLSSPEHIRMQINALVQSMAARERLELFMSEEEYQLKVSSGNTRAHTMALMSQVGSRGVQGISRERRVACLLTRHRRLLSVLQTMKAQDGISDWLAKEGSNLFTTNPSPPNSSFVSASEATIDYERRVMTVLDFSPSAIAPPIAARAFKMTHLIWSDKPSRQALLSFAGDYGAVQSYRQWIGLEEAIVLDVLLVALARALTIEAGRVIPGSPISPYLQSLDALGRLFINLTKSLLCAKLKATN